MKTGYKIIIEGAYVYHRHIESAHYDYETKAIIVRTVSGNEHSLSCDDPKKLKPFVEALDDRSELVGKL
jgi:hypothetical protein